MKFGPPDKKQSQMMLLGCGSSGSGSVFTPPLDAVTSKLIAAYGLGCLLTGVTDAANVRAVGGANDGAATDVGTLASGDFDAASFTTWIDGGSGWATAAYDHKAANNVLHATAANQPQISLTAIGGKAGLVFTGAEWLSTAGNVTGTNFGTGDYEVWYVVRPTTLSGGDIAIGARGNYSPEIYTRAGAVNKPALYAGAYLQFDTVLTVDTDYIIRFYRHSGVLYCDVNNVQEATTHANATDYAVDARLTLGADSPAGADKAKSKCAFNAWFNSALTAGEATTLAAALSDYFSIPLGA